MTRVSSATREQIRRRAQQRCEYYRLPEKYTVFPYHVDHIIPYKQEGKSTLDNLAWSCPLCNSFKASSIAGYDEHTKELTPLYNPRTQQWDQHFSLDEAKIVGMTAIRRVTVRILKMNQIEQVDLRLQLIQAGLY